ncbi:MAG: lamin tail domain-containing protein [Verrucomicrobiae bacterium]|nr:lamin tail domain-containing protein [Verrucomicrobiae bacterium]
MKPPLHHIAGLFLATLQTQPAPAGPPVAITEVMTAPSSAAGEDFFELTNYGPDAVDLEALWFADDAGFGAAHRLSDLARQVGEAPVLHPGETLVFVRASRNMPGEAEFRAWWGDVRLADRRVIAAPWGFGLNAIKDELRLWHATATATNQLDHVPLGVADRGTTFTSHAATGVFGALSLEGEQVAFRAAAGGDVGSPGTAGAAVPLRVVQDPADVETDAGATAVLSVAAHGLPRPRYQWLFEGEDLPGATASLLVLSNATPAVAGTYTVRIENGLESLVTAPARLSVNQTPRCAAIVRPPADLEVTPGQTAVFCVEVRGYPLPEILWRHEGETIPDATNAVLELPGVSEAHAGRYTVEVRNPLCSTNATASLSVLPPPRLVVTEAMLCQAAGFAPVARKDWWELTNRDTRPVNLRGWRFDDYPGVLDGAFAITNDVWLQPGQSAVLVSDLDAEAFRRWWGESNLPPDLPIISYFGNGFSNDFTELITLWNSAAREDHDFILKFELRVCLEFPNPCPCGVSRWYDPHDPDAALSYNHSVAGEHGAFRAAASDDVGSPGWLSNDHRPARPELAVARAAAGLELTWTALPGRTYEVQRSDALPPAAWAVRARVTAVAGTAGYTDTPVTAAAQWYRVTLLPETP